MNEIEEVAMLLVCFSPSLMAGVLVLPSLRYSIIGRLSERSLLVLGITVLLLLGSSNDALARSHGRLDLLFLSPVSRSLLQNLISLCYSDGVLIKLASCCALLLFLTGFFVFQLLDWFVDNLHKILLKGLLFKNKAVLVPYEIRHLGVPSVLLHASLKQP